MPMLPIIKGISGDIEMEKACPVFNTKCGLTECEWFDDANNCCSLKTVAISLSIIATNIQDHRVNQHI